jgi:hypothetical protein
MDLINTINSENWKLTYKLSQDDKKDNEHNTFVIVSEFTGTKLDIPNKEISDRNDIILLVPMITFNFTNKTDISSLILKALKAEFLPYFPGDLPTTYYCSKYVKAELKEFDLVIKIKVEENFKNIIINLSEKERNFLINCDSFSFAIIDGRESYIRRVKFSHSTSDEPIFPKKNISITVENIDSILPRIIEHIDTLEKVHPANLNTFLDIIGSSDYDVYQSTSSSESLPSLKNLALGKNCYVCGKEEVTREHCSPKWLTDKYKVKPLIGNILCSECNGWFGRNYEKAAEEKLKIKSCCLTDEQRLFISKWCIKTAITMSLASGVSVDAKWLPKLKNGEFPDGIEVYFDTRFGFNENGFNYGVSRFNKNLLREGFFFFSFICKDFSFVVIKRKHNESLVLPFYKFFPKFEWYKSNEIASNFADFHQKIHELLSKEKTLNFSLPIRKQSKRH